MKNSSIGWCHHTYNPWYGCEHKVDDGVLDPACQNCYAETLMDKRFSKVKWGKNRPRILTSEANRENPYSWNKRCAALGIRERVFSLSLGDWLDDAVPIEWLAELLCTVVATSNLDWLLLTKRPENWKPRLEQIKESKFGGALLSTAPAIADAWLSGNAPPNVWVGVTCGTQATADKRIPILLNIPATIRFISCEPLSEPIRLAQSHKQHFYHMSQQQKQDLAEQLLAGQSPPLPKIDWVIIGGESGTNARPFHLEYARHLVGQCNSTKVFVKQLGTHPYLDGRRIKLKHKKGEDINEFPEDLRVQEVPLY